MFVGESGLTRVIERTIQLMKQNKNEDARAEGGIDLETMQRFFNFWYTVSLDLFGGEISSNAASYFASSVKGRAKEDKYDDHVALTGTFKMSVPVVEGGVLKHLKDEEVPLRNAMNEVLREEYVVDSQRGVDKWNKLLEKNGLSFRFKLPHRRFHRQAGIYAGLHFDPEGRPISALEWEANKDKWIPSAADDEYVASLMTKPIYDPKQMANWIAPPPRGVKGQAVDYEYVRHQI